MLVFRKAMYGNGNSEVTQRAQRLANTMNVAIQTKEKEKKKKETTRLKITNPVIDFKALWQECKSIRFNPKNTEVTEMNSKSSQTEKSKTQWIKDLVKTTWFIGMVTSVVEFSNEGHNNQ